MQNYENCPLGLQAELRLAAARGAFGGASVWQRDASAAQSVLRWRPGRPRAGRRHCHRLLPRRIRQSENRRTGAARAVRESRPRATRVRSCAPNMPGRVARSWRPRTALRVEIGGAKVKGRLRPAGSCRQRRSRDRRLQDRQGENPGRRRRQPAAFHLRAGGTKPGSHSRIAGLHQSAERQLPSSRSARHSSCAKRKQSDRHSPPKLRPENSNLNPVSSACAVPINSICPAQEEPLPRPAPQQRRKSELSTKAKGDACASPGSFGLKTVSASSSLQPS